MHSSNAWQLIPVKESSRILNLAAISKNYQPSFQIKTCFRMWLKLIFVHSHHYPVAGQWWMTCIHLKEKQIWAWQLINNLRNLHISLTQTLEGVKEKEGHEDDTWLKTLRKKWSSLTAYFPPTPTLMSRVPLLSCLSSSAASSVFFFFFCEI